MLPTFLSFGIVPVSSASDMTPIPSGKQRIYRTGITSGQICTHIVGERPICCDMGIQGCLLCALSTPISFYSIPGGFLCFFCISWYQRNEVIRQWNVIDEEPCCCGSCNPACSMLHFHCNYPCSFFQIYMSILEFEAAERDAAPASVAVAQPIAQAAVINAVASPSAPMLSAK
jgi:hypothetical protein